MTGRLYRRKMIAVADGFETVAAMEDDFHHFAVRLSHDGTHVTELVGESIRYPWSSCPGAVSVLERLVGTPLRPSAADPGPRTHISAHCTHLFDVAKFAIAQSARGGRRQYDIVIPDPAQGYTEGDLSRDGVHLLHWKVQDRVVTAPPELAGHALEGRAEWPEGYIADADALEAALMLRRALVIFRGRMPEVPTIKTADQVPGGFGTCFTYQPENAASGVWVMEEKNHTGSADPLLAGFPSVRL